MWSLFYPFLENIEDPFIISALLSLSVDFNSSFVAKLGIYVHGSPERIRDPFKRSIY
jgi:hypothetical protein